MLESLIRLAAISLSAILSITISMKLGLSKKLWTLLNKKINPQHNTAIWITFVFIFNILSRILCSQIGIEYNELINVVVLGCSFLFMPDLSLGKRQ